MGWGCQPLFEKSPLGPPEKLLIRVIKPLREILGRSRVRGADPLRRPYGHLAALLSERRGSPAKWLKPLLRAKSQELRAKPKGFLAAGGAAKSGQFLEFLFDIAPPGWYDDGIFPV